MSDLVRFRISKAEIEELQSDVDRMLLGMFEQPGTVLIGPSVTFDWEEPPARDPRETMKPKHVHRGRYNRRWRNDTKMFHRREDAWYSTRTNSCANG